MCVPTLLRLATLVFCGKAALEAKYKEELDEAFGIKFNNLFTITNMPIKVSTKSQAGTTYTSKYTATNSAPCYLGVNVSFLHHKPTRAAVVGAALCGLPVPEGRATGVHGAAGPQLQRGGMQWAHVQVRCVFVYLVTAPTSEMCRLSAAGQASRCRDL